MFSKRSIVIIMVLFLSIGQFLAAQVQYAPTYLEARQTAIEKEKPYMIIFQKSDCEPCNWLEENSLGNKKVQSHINSNYIAVNVDIDDFDGFALKKYYEVNQLPSILIFTPKGAEVRRIEQVIAANELLAVLNNPETELAFEEDRADKPKPTTDHAVSQTVPDKPMSRKELQADQAHFAVQLGVFSDSTNARDLANKVQRISSKEVFLKKDGAHYKVFSGPSASRQEVEAHLQQLKDYGYNGFIKSISLSSKI